MEDLKEKLRDEVNDEIHPYHAKQLLMEAGIEEELAYYLSQRLINGTKTVMKGEVQKHIDKMTYWLNRV